jgi:hypothetical protein
MIGSTCRTETGREYERELRVFYDIFYKCPECGSDELVTSHIQLDSPDYDGLPLTDFYFPDKMAEVIAETRHKCPSSSAAKAEDFYVRKVTPPSPSG